MVVGSTLMVKIKALTLVTCPESESERKTGNGTLAPAQSLFSKEGYPSLGCDLGPTISQSVCRYDTSRRSTFSHYQGL